MTDWLNTHIHIYAYAHRYTYISDAFPIVIYIYTLSKFINSLHSIVVMLELPEAKLFSQTFCFSSFPTIFLHSIFYPFLPFFLAQKINYNHICWELASTKGLVVNNYRRTQLLWSCNYTVCTLLTVKKHRIFYSCFSTGV